jgi:peptidoglycan hydrolase CwlO-like protein
MKKAIFVLAVLCYALHSQAAASFKADTVDSVKFNKKVAKLKVDLTELTSELSKVQNQIPVDSAKAAETVQKSHNAQEKSKDKAKDAVGGSVSDAKKAEKSAKDAENATDDANDATKQLEKDRKKVKSLTKDIAKTQKKLDDLMKKPE